MFLGARTFLATASLVAVSFTAQAGAIVDLTASDGLFTPGTNWNYVGGTGWVLTGANNLNTLLTSPSFIAGGGAVTLQLTHSYNFELNWDGGVVELSVNGGAFGLVPGLNFSQNGYVPIGFNNVVPNGFTGSSGGTLVSSAFLGFIPLGTSYQIQFHANYDSSIVLSGGGPAWTISNITLEDDGLAEIPEPGTWSLLLGGCAFLYAGRRFRRKS